MGKSILIGIWEGNSIVEVTTHELDSLSKLKSDLGLFSPIDFNLVHSAKSFEHLNFDSFDPLEVKNYFPINGQLEKKIVDFEKLKQQKVYCVSALPRLISSQLEVIGPKKKIHHASTALANTLLDAKDQMLVMINERQVQLVIHKDNGFKFYCQEDAFTANDFLYYILLAVKRLKIDISDIKVSIGGSIDQLSPLYTLLKSYIPHMEFFSSTKFKLDGSAQPFHYYLPLIIGRACA